MKQFINRIPKWIRTIVKWLFISTAVLLVLGGILMGALIYEMRYKLSTVGREVSPDGVHSVLFQAVGEADFPFGSSHAKITVYEGETKITTFREDISDDGGAFRPANYKVEWMPAGVLITFMGSEQPDREVEVYFDGRDAFEGYSNEEIEEILKQRYGIGRVDAILRNGEVLTIRADGLTFYGINHLALHETYRQEKFKAFAERVFGEHLFRSLDWEVETGDEVTDIRYIPVISYNGAPGREDLEWFCDDICLWLEECYAEFPYEECRDLYRCIIPDLYGYGREKYYFGDFSLRTFEEDESNLYNELYAYLNQVLSGENQQTTDGEGSDSADSGESDADYAEDIPYEDAFQNGTLPDPEMVAEWATWDADAVYDLPDGGAYAMIPVDRALGSSFYILMFYEKKGNADTASLVSGDPFQGSIGEASFLTFLDDKTTGFACLTHSGGSYGELFRTDNGGKNFSSVALPSPEIALPDGKYYNPFVMPEKVWEEDGAVYLLAGQGPDSDYHNPAFEGWPVGIYVSHDGGETFEFLEERER